MSYCRWSSMNWRCDLYIYENVAGCWTIHVASQRVSGKLPPEPLLSLPEPGAPEEDMKKWMRRYRKHRNALEVAPMVEIALPHAGETFNLPSPGECADKVEELIALGYLCPDYVVPELREEQAELDATPLNQPGAVM